MTTDHLPEHPDLDQLRSQARELQRRVRAGDHGAAGDVGGAGPDFSLAAAQLALSRRYGFASWTRLRRHVDAITARSWDHLDPPDTAPWADRFVALACLTYHQDAPWRRHEAARLLAERGPAAMDSLPAAAVSGDAAAVRRLLTGPSAASAPSGPFGWSPLMYLAYARLDVEESAVLETARVLLDAGADPNDGRFFAGLATPFTVLTGVLGGGEQDQPAHPHALALARLLLEGGAEANDAQALYNRMFRTEDDFLGLLFEFGLGRGDGGPWRRLLPDVHNAPATLVHDLFEWAVVHDQRARVALLLEHGADPNGTFGGGTSALDLAERNGHRELAELLREAGGVGSPLDPADAFVAAVLAGDADAVAATPPEIVEQVRTTRPGLVVWAAARGRIAPVELLVAAGFDIDALGRGDVPVEQEWQTALHTAVETGEIALVRRLVELGADRTIRDTRFGGTAADWAEHFGRDDLAAALTD